MSVAVSAVVVSAGVGLYSANKASSAQNKATDAAAAAGDRQANIGDKQVALAQEQWDYQKNVYLPKSMQMADDSAALSKKVADRQLADSDYYRGVSSDAIGQAKKSWKYQDKYMDMTDAYVNGTQGNVMADEANADVQQAAGLQRGATQRAMQRRGINASSGAGLAMMQDDQLATAAGAAGAQTNARRIARDKAEQMVGIAAGSGTAGFGTGMSAGGLATGASAGAVNAGGAGNAVLNGVNNGVGANYSGINSGFGGGSNSFRGSGQSAMSTVGYGSQIGSAIGSAANDYLRSGIKFPSFNKPTPVYSSSNDTYDAYDYSDIRLKTNLRCVGTTRAGHGWYTWDWKEGGSSQGVIAQFVAAVDPRAVRADAQGFLLVDYARV